MIRPTEQLPDMFVKFVPVHQVKGLSSSAL